jgi:penicillin amidase
MRAIQADANFPIGQRLAEAVASLRTGGAADAALALLRDWDGQSTADSAAAAYANLLWDELVQNLFVRQRDVPAEVGSQSRMSVVVEGLLDDPGSPWWANPGLGVAGQQDMLALSAEGAYQRLADLQGKDPTRWNWGELHALFLRHGTFGSSGIAPIEWLFNRGPYPVGGGATSPNATGADEDFATTTGPSMRMIVDLSDFDASSWNNLTGSSGHIFHPNYVDQINTWLDVQTTPWPFTPQAVAAATTNTLRLTPRNPRRRV